MQRMEPFFELIKMDNRGDDSVPRKSHARLFRNGTVVINSVYVSDDKDMCISQRDGSLENIRLAELAEMFEM
ncbi:MAG: hypothetical protein IJZ82_08775 [Lachnospiraceae bacterium]|nr:hypothetical protein [Lachnospiraceae bacterium]